MASTNARDHVTRAFVVRARLWWTRVATVAGRARRCHVRSGRNRNGAMTASGRVSSTAVICVSGFLTAGNTYVKRHVTLRMSMLHIARSRQMLSRGVRAERRLSHRSRIRHECLVKISFRSATSSARNPSRAAMSATRRAISGPVHHACRLLMLRVAAAVW